MLLYIDKKNKTAKYDKKKLFKLPKNIKTHKQPAHENIN